MLFINQYWEANNLFACWAVDLALGNTLQCKTIKSGTIEGYLRAAADTVSQARRRAFIGTHADAITWYDPRIDLTTGKTATTISAVMKELKRWEAMPDRREPLTVNMTKWLGRQGDESTPYSLAASLGDWSVIGMYVGPRLTEWAQDDSGSITLTRAKEPKAFCIGDIEYFAKNCRPLTRHYAHRFPKLVHTANITFREQKNGDDGAKRTIVRDFGNPSLCAVSAMLRITQRWCDLHLPTNQPLSCFTDDGTVDGNVRNICASHIARALQAAARAAHGITSPELLARFTSHSFRVGACVALHAAGISALNIKHALRWKSEAFMEYLRNLPLQAQRNSRAVTDFNPMILDITPPTTYKAKR